MICNMQNSVFTMFKIQRIHMAVFIEFQTS